MRWSVVVFVLAFSLACAAPDGDVAAEPAVPVEVAAPVRAAVPRPEGPVAYVQAASFSNLRAEPNPKGALVLELPRDTEVVLMGPSQGTETYFGITGGWVQVWASGQVGYLFDGFLLPFHAPPQDCASLEAWAKQIGHAGSRQITSRPCVASEELGPEGEEGCYTEYRTPLTGGASFGEYSGYESSGTTLNLPGVSRDRAWAAVRNCFVKEPNFQGHPLPTVAGPTPQHGPSVEAIVEEAVAGWRFDGGIGGCSSAIVLQTVGNDVEINYSGGC